MTSDAMQQGDLLQLGGGLLHVGKLDEAFELYRRAFSKGELEEKHLADFASALLSVEETRLAEEKALSCHFAESAEIDEKRELKNILTCNLCQELFQNPFTLVCGHTFCMDCLATYKLDNLVSCPGCGVASKLQYSLNIIIRDLIRLWFGKIISLREGISDAEKLLSAGKKSEFMSQIESLLTTHGDDADLFRLRSKGFLHFGSFAEALKDLEMACKRNPLKSKAFFSRGELLSSCGNYEEAVIMFLRASALSPTDISYRVSLTSCLRELFRKISKVCPLSSEKSEKNPFCTTEMFEFQPTDSRLKPNCAEQSHEQDDFRKSSHRDDGKNSLARLVSRRQNVTVLKGCAEPDDDCKTALTTQSWKKSRETTEESETTRANESKGEMPEQAREVGQRINVDELECKLCFSLIYEPVTTPCGHSFCRSCLSRCLDHRFDCPCCRTDLQKYLELVTQGRRGVCQVLEAILKTKFAEEYNARKISYENELKSASGDNTVEIPIFVCTLAVPNIACPLHIFEPRYKLMIRRCMESGFRQFGMCVPDPEHGFASVGTMLEIDEVEFLPDGRSIVHTVGGRRFKVLEKGMKDGYNVAKVEWLVDEPTHQTQDDSLNSEVYNLMVSWVSNLTSTQQQCIVQALGQMPDQQQRTDFNGFKWLWWLLAAIPLNIEAKLIILSMTSMMERLSSARRFLVLLLKQQRGVDPLNE